MKMGAQIIKAPRRASRLSYMLHRQKANEI